MKNPHRLAAIVGAFVIACLLCGCANLSPESIKGQQRSEAILAEPLSISRLPISVVLEIDRSTREWSVDKRPSRSMGAAPHISIVCPVGKHLAAGAEQVVKDTFLSDATGEGGARGGRLEVRLEDCSIEYGLHGFHGQYAQYRLTLTVRSDLIARDNRVLYSKKISIDYPGWSRIYTGGRHLPGQAFSKGLGTLVALWMREFAEDITKDQTVRQYAESVASAQQRERMAGPQITIAGPRDGTVTKLSRPQLVATVQSKRPLKVVSGSVNGRAVALKVDRGKVNQEIQLAPGENVISITAVDMDGGTTIEVIRVTRTDTQLVSSADIPTSAEEGRRWAVVVGVSRYEHEQKGIPVLPGAADDARAFASFLMSSAGGGFDKERVLLLVDEAATSAALRRALFTYLKKAIEEDVVVLFFSGQGMPEPGSPENYYLLTHDADPESLPSSALPTWDIERAFQRSVKAKRAVILLDGCDVGKTEPGTRGLKTGRALTDAYVKRLSQTGEGKAVFAMVMPHDAGARSVGGGQRLFTRSLLDGLKGWADKNRDKTVTLGEIIDYTSESLTSISGGTLQPTVSGRFDRSLPMAVLE